MLEVVKNIILMTRAGDSVAIDYALAISNDDLIFRDSILATGASGLVKGDASHAIRWSKMQMLHQ